MNDFNGSVAQQDVSISTEVKKVAVVGGNFYDSILYVTDRFSSFETDTPSFPVVTKQTYEDVIAGYSYLSEEEKKIIVSNLSSLFLYGQDVTVYIIPSSKLGDMKMYGYFTYLDLKFKAGDGKVADYALDETAETTLAQMKTYDKDFTALITDLPVDCTKMKGVDTATTAGTVKVISEKSVDMALFARPAVAVVAAEDGVEPTSTKNAYLDETGEIIGPSPALYQLGRSLSRYNESGTPVGNSFDMDAVNFVNVLPTGESDLDVLSGAGSVLANFFASINLNYFKPVGNGTMQITNMGGWTIFKDCIGANWIVAYLNYMNRVACATIITSGNALKSVKTYETLLASLVANVKTMIANGRIEQFKLTAPSFGSLPTSNGSTIIIPDAWTGYYVDNVRKVRISGTLTVTA